MAFDSCVTITKKSSASITAQAVVGRQESQPGAAASPGDKNASMRGRAAARICWVLGAKNASPAQAVSPTHIGQP